jgi:hypothetical protein
MYVNTRIVARETIYSYVYVVHFGDSRLMHECTIICCVTILLLLYFDGMIVFINPK